MRRAWVMFHIELNKRDEGGESSPLSAGLKGIFLCTAMIQIVALPSEACAHSIERPEVTQSRAPAVPVQTEAEPTQTEATQTEVAPTQTEAAPQPPVIAIGDSLYYRPRYFADARVQSALDMVQLVPGFAIKSGPAGRGLEGAAPNVLIDGRQLPAKGEPVASILSKIPATSVVGIYVVRGPTRSIDLQGYDEVLVIYRFPRSEAGASATVSAGRTGGSDTISGSLAGTIGRPGRAVSGGVTNARTAGGNSSTLTATDGAEDDIRTNSKSATKGANANADLKLDDSTNLRADASYSRSDYYSAQDREREGMATVGVLSSGAVQSGKVSARLDRRFDSKWSAALDAVHSGSRSESASASTATTGTNRFASGTDMSETATALTLHWTPEGPWRVETVIDYAHNRLDSEAVLSSGNVVTPLPGSDIVVTEQRWGASSRIGWTPKGDWSGTFRLRVNRAAIEGRGDIAARRGFTEIKPELTVLGKLAGIELDLRLAREIDQLAFSAFTASAALDEDLVTLGNAQIDPERRWVAETTLSKRLLGTGQVSLAMYGERIDNPVELVAQPAGYDARANIDTATRANVTAKASLPLDRIGIEGGQLDLSGSLGFSRVTDPTTGATRRLSGDAKGSYSVGFRQVMQAIPLSYGFSATEVGTGPSYRSQEISVSRRGPALSGFAEYDLNPNLSVRGQLSWNGPSRYERILFAQSRAGAPPIDRRLQFTPAVTGGQVTVRLEI